MCIQTAKKGKVDSSKEYEFVKANDWASWLHSNHDKEPGVWVVFPKKTSGEKSITYEEALDIALAYGWIDISIRKIDEISYSRKFTPRRADSSWTTGNVERVKKLIKDGKMTSWGLEAYKRRSVKAP